MNVRELRIRNQENGSGALILPIHKWKGREVPGRTGLRKDSEPDRRYRPGAAILPRRFSKEDSRCRGVKGRAEVRDSSGEAAGHLPNTDPCWSKASAGSRGESTTILTHAMLRPCMPAGERTVQRVTWNHFHLWCSAFYEAPPRLPCPYPTFSDCCVVPVRRRHENFSLHARKLAKLQRQNSQR